MSEGVLKKFYKSKEWRNLRERLILERGTICEDCKKQIVESRFIQLHHIIELTETNYLDSNISLNPSNIKVLCQQCHNKTHGRWCKGAIRKPKGVYIIYGPPMSGKTTYVKENMQRGDIIVDMDRLYEAVTLLPRYDKPNCLKYNVLAIRNSILDNIKTRYGSFNSAWIIGGYADKYQREQLVKELGAKAILIKATKEDCIYRLQYSNDYRQENQEEWTSYINKWFETFSE